MSHETKIPVNKRNWGRIEAAPESASTLDPGPNPNIWYQQRGATAMVPKVCSVKECDNETELYLCRRCILDLEAWLDKVPALRQSLFTTMARQDAVAPRNSEGSNGATKGSPMPINTSAMDMRYALAIWEGKDAEDLAMDKYAGGFIVLLIDLITKAEQIIDIPAEMWSATCICGELVTSEFESATCEMCGANNRKGTLNANKARKIAPELVTTKGLIQWIKTFTGHVVTENQIYIWANRGQIPQAQAKPPMYDPLAVAVSKGLYSRQM